MSSKKAVVVSPSKGKTEDDFRAQYDKNFIVPKKIREYLAALGPRNWENEKEVMIKAGISQTDIAVFRPQFEEFIVVARGPNKHPQNLWCGSKALAAKFRVMVGKVGS